MSSFAADVAVVGGGPAGMACALTARQLGLSVTLFEGTALGGELNTLNLVEHLPGRPSVSGPDLAADFIDALFDRDVEVRFDEVADLSWDGGAWSCAGLRAGWLVLATGCEIDLTGLPGAEAAQGHGVSLCASCDAPLFKGKPVVVLGAGRDARSEADELRRYASQVLLVVTPEEEPGLRRGGVDPDGWVVARRVVEVVGSPVSGLRIEDAVGAEVVIPTSGVFPARSRRPRDGLIAAHDGAQREPLSVEPAGRQTSGAPGNLLAIGDVRAGSSATLAGAIGDGVAAAWTVLRHSTDTS